MLLNSPLRQSSPRPCKCHSSYYSLLFYYLVVLVATGLVAASPVVDENRRGDSLSSNGHTPTERRQLFGVPWGAFGLQVSRGDPDPKDSGLVMDNSEPQLPRKIDLTVSNEMPVPGTINNGPGFMSAPGDTSSNHPSPVDGSLPLPVPSMLDHDDAPSVPETFGDEGTTNGQLPGGLGDAQGAGGMNQPPTTPVVDVPNQASLVLPPDTREATTPAGQV
ncbi:hypothetical protein HYQ46_001008 [Verticillium longisporum]|nr:hypothetical protein HYQ46_001008 [Verticillium longisporum]